MVMVDEKELNKEIERITLAQILDFMSVEKDDLDLSREIGGESVGHYEVRFQILENDDVQVVLAYAAGTGSEHYSWSANYSVDAFLRMLE
jgi:hypothetical protein